MKRFDEQVAPYATQRGRDNKESAFKGAASGAGDVTVRYYSARCLAEVEPRPVHWLWQDRIACGKLNLIAGHPGRGKSTLTLHMAALVSIGGTWPDGAPCPAGNVIFITCEDDAADTLVPRLLAAGSDSSRCHLLDTVTNGKGGWRPFNLRSDVAVLDQLARDIGGVSLVIIDPISAYLDGIDSHSVAEVRGGLVPLQQFAEHSGAAIVLVTHFNKGTPDGSAMSRVAGSGAFVAVCRSAWAVDRDPEQPTGRRRVFAPMKNNIGDDRTGFMFELEPFEIGEGIRGSRVRFLPGTVSISADELVRSQTRSTSRSSAKGKAMAFLAQLLSSGPLPPADIEAATKAAGHSWRTVQRAKEALDIQSLKRRGEWLWELPAVTSDHVELLDSQDCQERQDCQAAMTEAGGTLAECEAEAFKDRQGCQIVPPENFGGLGNLGNLGNLAREGTP